MIFNILDVFTFLHLLTVHCLQSAIDLYEVTATFLDSPAFGTFLIKGVNDLKLPDEHSTALHGIISLPVQQQNLFLLVFEHLF